MNEMSPDFRPSLPERCALRKTITDQTRAPEWPLVASLAQDAALTGREKAEADRQARALVAAVRAAGRDGFVQELVQEFDLSTREGIALMCLAEALLRIPDAATRDALLQDKLTDRDWASHLRRGRPLLLTLASGGLLASGLLLSTDGARGLGGLVCTMVRRCGVPAIRVAVDRAMRRMGEQFIRGETIEGALRNSGPLMERGYGYSYDMLGEAAMTHADAARYCRDYERAIHAIGATAGGHGVINSPGISIKLSALHPRYTRLKREQVMDELLPVLTALARLAAGYDIGFTIDAEEAERLELSLDLLEALSADPPLASWQGLGFVVQAYQKRAPLVIDWIIDLSRRHGRRMMVRLVKGAYWDAEIKRAQVEGMSEFPVYTAKAHTDIAYIACARRLLAAEDAVFPQFATHNSQTLSAIMAMSGPKFKTGQYEFQCLHGMGEDLYDAIVATRPVRIYAPVGTHETLLAYLVRRLLENGANSSFVNRVRNAAVAIDDLVEEPTAIFLRGETRSKVTPPDALFAPQRRNSSGLDLNDERVLRDLASLWPAASPGAYKGSPVFNPARAAQVVGHCTVTPLDDLVRAVDCAEQAAAGWAAWHPADRAALLLRAADLLEERRISFFALLAREAGKTLANAVGEVREAVDFLRYYAQQISGWGDGSAWRPLGVAACISPWNFPLAIFLGQVVAALAAGNTVVAKPAEETPLVGALALRLLHDAGIPRDVLHLVIGAGEVGAALVGHRAVQAVLFTGSTDVARLIQRQLAERLTAEGRPVPLIAETGGQNAMIVDSSALVEQVVADVLASAFDSAGQRCSALRVLYVQEETADRMLAMLKGAMEALRTGDPALLETDVGPVISDVAKAGIDAHINAMRIAGYPVFQAPLSAETRLGTFVAPTIIEIPSIACLTHEVFGPVLHVIRYRRSERDALITALNDTGYALTFGLHSRVDRDIDRAVALSTAGNIYVNRNIVGAIVGSQPFGGHGLSGTGPKAGGPLYLRRLVARAPALPQAFAHPLPDIARSFADWWLRASIVGPLVRHDRTPLGTELALPGPTGEQNRYTLLPRGTVYCDGPEAGHLAEQILAALSTGNRIVIPRRFAAALSGLPAALRAFIQTEGQGLSVDVALTACDGRFCVDVNRRLAALAGAIIPLVTPTPEGHYPLEWLVSERVVSTNTTAAGGNAALMML